jgi:HPt (histidine-containing phosphotransfer) domain-containing protein
MMEYNAQDYFNVDEALSRIRGDKNTLKLLIGLFVDSKEMAGLEQALAEEDYPSAAAFAHGIKGVAGNLSFTAMYNISSKLNEELKLGAPNKETVEEYYAVLDGTKAAAKEVVAGL